MTYIPIELGDFLDVDLDTTAPADGQALVYDDASGLWVPGTVSGGGSAFPDYVQATAPATPAEGEFWWDTALHVLKYFDGSAWKWSTATIDPLSIDWHAAFWAEDPNWAAPGDGNAVSQWDDASGNGRHAVQSTAAAQPIFRSSVSSMRTRPAVDFDGTDDWLATAAFASAITGVSEIFVVARLDTVKDCAIVHGISGTARRAVQTISAGANWAVFQGSTTVSGGATDTDAHAFRAVFDTTDELHLDGALVASGDAGSENLTGLRIGANAGGSGFFLDGQVAFVGLKEGTLTAQERSDLLAWARDHYGTP